MNEKTKASPELYIEPNTLNPPSSTFDGSYTLTLTITDADDPLISVPQDVTFRTLSSQVQAFIKGGDTVASRAVEFVLDGSDSTDPDDALCGDECSQFIYTWRCSTNEDEPQSCYEDENTG